MSDGQDPVVYRIPDGYDKAYIYFNVGRKVYRIKKSLMLFHAYVNDAGMKKKIKEHNKKLRELVCEMPIEIYKETHFYSVNGAGEIIDKGERYPRKGRLWKN